MNDKEAIGFVLFACGAAYLSGAHMPLECRPAIELCNPPAILLLDMPHPDHAPSMPAQLNLTVAASTVTSSGGVGWVMPPTKSDGRS